MNAAFRRFAQWVSIRMGSPWAFCVALAAIVGWACIGPLFDFSDSWQLVLNTVTSVMAFLMVFLIQNSQNRDAQTIQLKLNELIRAMDGARNRLMDLEGCTDEELRDLEREFERIKRGR